MEKILPAEFVLFDLEYTASAESQARNWEGEHREVIQIGAIRVTSPDFLEHDSLLAYVRPAKDPALSDFIIELTGITQRDIDTKGVPFPDAYRQLLAFVGESAAFCWGRDIEVLKENGELNGVSVELPDEQFKNLRPLMAMPLAEAGVDIEAYSSGTLLSAFGKAPPLRAHDALNDMRNLLDALHELHRRAGI